MIYADSVAVPEGTDAAAADAANKALLEEAGVHGSFSGAAFTYGPDRDGRQGGAVRRRPSEARGVSGHIGGV